MFSSTRNGLFIIPFAFLLVSTVKGQTTATSTVAGAWETGSNWSTSPAAPSTSSLNNIVVINRPMTFTSGSITGYNSTTITIKSGGSLTVTGNFALKGSGVVITIQSGGSLSVSGTTSVTNNASITVQSGATATFATLAAKSAGSIIINSGATATATSVTTTSNSDAIINNQGTLTVNGSVDSNGVINNSGTMNVSGDFTEENSGNSSVNSGTLNVGGNAYAYGLIQLNPGASSSSTMNITGSLAVTANANMVVGTNVSSCGSAITNYANLVVQTDVNLTGSGDIVVNQTGRLVVFGNINGASSSGTLVTINCGGQTYVNGNVNLGTGGGNTVTNNNTSGSPPTGSNGNPVIGLYVNGTTTAQTTTGTVGTKSQLQANDNSFYTYIHALPNSPLPVTLLYFRVDNITPEGILLKWATATELNFNYFEIEKSTDGKSFSSIGQVQGNGTTNIQHNYSFTDTAPIIGHNYYRLKSVDFDGFTEIFSVVVADFTSGKNASVYPNPLADGNLHIDLNFEGAETSIRITDINGIQKEIATSSDSQTILPLSLDPGLYLITIVNGTFKQVSRLLVK